MKVTIENYQAIKKAELDFDKGLTVIVGSSNNGKSSIIRAIEAAINNKGGSDFINYGSDRCLVTIEDGDDKVVWSKNRNSTKSYYDINGQVLNKIGQKQIEDVGKTLNMPEVVVNNDKFRLNFWKQLDFPFLVGKTHYQLFDFISKSKDQEIMANLLNETTEKNKDNKKELSEVNTQINTRTKDIADIEEQIKKLEKYEDFDLERFEKLVQVVRQIKAAVQEYEELPEKIEEQERSIAKLQEDVNKKQDIFSKTEHLFEEIANLEPTVQKIKSSLEEVDSIESKISKAKEGIRQIEESVEKESRALESFDVCPFCHQPLDKEHGGHHE